MNRVRMLAASFVFGTMALIASQGVAVQDKDKGDKPDPKPGLSKTVLDVNHVRKLVRRLGSDNWRERVAAESELIKLSGGIDLLIYILKAL